jgi:D-cysteine desulfhydrase
VNCYEEIRRYERENNICFDYIFHASGTGTTQAGLVCGQLINGDSRKIIGISIARKCPYGRDVVIGSISDYLAEHNVPVSADAIQDATVFLDEYVDAGYGSYSAEVENAIQTMMTEQGVPLDFTYTGKAYSGMMNYLEKNKIKGKNVLFIHTGGTPLFFDFLNRM